jgi:hypothetical protein
MTVARNLVNKIETAFIETLKTNTDFGSTPIRSWKSGANTKVMPAVLVHCEPPIIPSIDYQMKAGLYETLVDIACFTYTPDDESKTTIEGLFASVYDSLSSSTLLSTLASKTSNITFYSVSITSQQAQFDESNHNIMAVTCTVRIKYG